MNETPAFEVGSEFAGYEIIELAGRGGMGVVYRVRNVILGKERALKVVSPELSNDDGFRARFRRESQVAASIEHPNVIPIYHAGEDGGLLYVVMEYVEGDDLAGVIRKQGRLPLERSIAIAIQVGSALDAAHRRGLVHRDVKPANILIASSDGDEHAYLTDFGLAKHLTSTSHLTETGAFVGTYQYAAPEQFMGDELDARADVYALGCVIFHALAGRPPFERDTVEALVGAHLFVDPPQLSECCSGTPTALDDVLSRALAKDPHGRYGSAGELVTAAHRTMGRGSDVARVKRSASPVRDAPTAAKAPGADAQPAPPRRPDRSPGPHGTSDRRSLNHTVLRAGALLAAIAAVATLLAVLRSGYTPAGNTVPPADVSRLTALPGTADVRALEGKQFPHDPACSFEPQAKPYQNSAPQEGLIRSVCANDRLGAGYVDIEDQGSAPHRPPACGKVHKVDGTRPYECSAHNGRIFAGADGSSIRVARLRFNDVVALLRDGH